MDNGGPYAPSVPVTQKKIVCIYKQMHHIPKYTHTKKKKKETIALSWGGEKLYIKEGEIWGAREGNEGDVGGNPVASSGGAGEGNIGKVDGGRDAREALRGVWEMATEALCPDEPGMGA